jgi:hypothetical protein
VVPGSTSAGAALAQQFEQLQAGPRRHHQLAVGSKQVLAFEALDDLGARGRCADAFGFLQALSQGLVLDEAPGVLHGVDQCAFAVARRRLGLLRLHARFCQSCGAQSCRQIPAHQRAAARCGCRHVCGHRQWP